MHFTLMGISMTTLLPTARATALRRAAVRATLAPSVHNTQPWRLHIKDGRLDIYADRTRRLPVLDPTSRQLVLSCGCAIMNARVSLAADGLAVDVRRSESPTDGSPLASLTPTRDEPDPQLAALDSVLELRQTNRRHFADDEVPQSVLSMLSVAAGIEGASLFAVRDPEHRVAVAVLSQRADEIENLNPAYRAELRAWTTHDSGRRDGVPDTAVPHVDGTAHDEVPIRDFDPRGTGGLPPETRSSKDQTLVLLCAEGDTPADWLRAGEAFERVLLEVARHGYAASPLTQVTEVPSTRAQLRHELGLVGYPHVLLRIGRAPMAPSSRRRRLVDVLVDES